MANIIISRGKTPGQTPFAERFPEGSRVADKLRDRRNQGKPIDGNCIKEHGQAMREAHSKCKF